MSATPITDKIIEDADACPETRIVFLIKHLANKCREFEKERGEWAEERFVLLARLKACRGD